jgi:hypothetical protein
LNAIAVSAVHYIALDPSLKGAIEARDEVLKQIKR